MNETTKKAKSQEFETELNYIMDPRIKESAKVLIDLLPDYFFEVPASSTGKHHPLFALGDGGLVRHTKVAVKIAQELFQDSSLTGGYSNTEKDLMIFGLMVHDGLKYGLEKSRYTRFDHPLVIANYIKENKDKLKINAQELEFLCGVVSSHMGPWNTSFYEDTVLPKPATSAQRLFHMCDYLASREFLNVKFDTQNNIEERS